MTDSKDTAASTAVALTEYARAAEEHFQAVGISQALIWYSGFLAGRLASCAKGMVVETREDPVFVEIFDCTDLDLPDNVR